MRSLITQPPFLTPSTCFDLSFSNINTEQSTHLDRHSLLKQAALLPAWAENKTANDTRQLLARLLNPHSLDVMAKSTVQGPLQNRKSNVGFCVHMSFQSQPRQLRQVRHLPLLLTSWNWVQSIKFTFKKKKQIYGRRMDPTMIWYHLLGLLPFRRILSSSVPRRQSAVWDGDHCVSQSSHGVPSSWLVALPTYALAPGWISGQPYNRPFSRSCLPPGESTYPGKAPSWDTSQDSRAYTFPCISWVIVGEGKEVMGSHRQCITSPKYRWNKSTPVLFGSHGAGAPAMAAYTVSSGAPKVSAKMVLSLFLSPTLWRPQLRGKTEGTQSVSSRDSWGWGGSFYFLPAYTCAE